MMMLDWYGKGLGPKRGDLLQSSVGTPRERTWLVLRVLPVRRRDPAVHRRYKVWMVRWWELEPEFRMKLFQSAERSGGQNCHVFWWHSREKRKTKEQEFFGAEFAVKKKSARKFRTA